LANTINAPPSIAGGHREPWLSLFCWQVCLYLESVRSSSVTISGNIYK